MTSPLETLTDDQQRAIEALAIELERPLDATIARLVQVGLKTASTYPGLSADLSAFLAEVTEPDLCN